MWYKCDFFFFLRISSPLFSSWYFMTDKTFDFYILVKYGYPDLKIEKSVLFASRKECFAVGTSL